MTPQAAETSHKMMPGTTTGNTYLMVGRVGNIAIGVKPTMVAKGEMFGVKGTTWFGLRLRAAPGGDLLEAPSTEGTVVNLAAHKTFELPADALPSVEWDKSDTSRASTTIGVMLRGGKDNLEVLIEAAGDGKLAAKIAAYVCELVGLKNLILTQREIAAWLDGHYAKFLEQSKAEVEAKAKLAETMEETIGMVGVQKVLLKKFYEATHQGAEPQDAGEQDEEETGEEDGSED